MFQRGWFNHQPGEYVIRNQDVWHGQLCDRFLHVNFPSCLMNKAWFRTDVLFLECHLDEGDVFSYTVWNGPTLLKDVKSFPSWKKPMMGRTGDLPIHEWLLFMVNVGKYTTPMDGMGYRQSGGFQYVFFASIKLGRWLQEFDEHVCLNRLKLTT